jgi:hypothetical protein
MFLSPVAKKLEKALPIYVSFGEAEAVDTKFFLDLIETPTIRTFMPNTYIPTTSGNNVIPLRNGIMMGSAESRKRTLTIYGWHLTRTTYCVFQSMSTRTIAQSTFITENEVECEVPKVPLADGYTTTDL